MSIIKDICATLWMLPTIVSIYWAGTLALQENHNWGWFLFVGCIVMFPAMGTMVEISKKQVST